jgi:ABC-type sugar transport system substrate-binding protein
MTKISALLCACLVMAGLVAGCGGGSSSSSSESTSSESSSGESTPAAGGGGKPEVPAGKTIGLINQAESPENSAIEQVVKELADGLGWQVKAINGQGSPEKISRAATTLKNEGIDAFVGITIEAPLVRTTLEEFKEEGVPTCAIGGGQPKTELYALQFDENERLLGKELGEYIAEKEPDAQVIALIDNPVYAGKERFEGFKEGLENSPGAAVVAENEINLEDPVGSTTKAVENGLAAQPDATAIYSIFDLYNPPADTAVKRLGSTAKVYGHFTSESSTKELRDPSNPLVALGDAGLPKSSGLCMEQFLHSFATGEPVNPKAMEENPVVYQVIGKDDVNKFVEPDEYFAFPPEKESAAFLEQFKQEYKFPAG